ncbi:polysaccharide pyruvyl transferase family protein [Chelatococcus sp. GCM10030263]|uniref:polysaccharide pyruvyl transferase family protein n=1 Tax=Chelatococcus sp. GCM10030263 TaxID=3273387 RepID=UPI003608C04F
MKIVLFNVKYSPNLGDGAIAECLERELERRFAGAEVLSLDLAGRTEWRAPEGGQARVSKLGILQRMPRWCRDIAVEAVLGARLRSRLRPLWRRALAGADVAVFGGGQLIQDGDLNFPLKLGAAADECRRLRIPYAVHAVGAAPIRSRRGRQLFLRFLSSAADIHIAARDTKSARELAQLTGKDVTVGRDPALLASRVWPAAERPARERPVVGLGVTHPAVLRYHGTDTVRDGDEAVMGLYVQLSESLVAAGYDVALFSNGAAEDEAFIGMLGERLRQAGSTGTHIRIVPRCGTPRELAALLAQFDALIAHRLHASILAYSYRVPHIGLLWDGKLSAYFASVERADYAVPLSAATIPTIVPLLGRARAEGIDAGVHSRVLNDTSDAIDALARALVAALPRGAEADREPVAAELAPPAELAQAGLAQGATAWR